MSDGPQGPGWWQAADLKWYPPDLQPDYDAAPDSAEQPLPSPDQPADGAPGPGWWRAADLKWYPPELHSDHEAPPEPLAVSPLAPPVAAPTGAGDPRTAAPPVRHRRRPWIAVLVFAAGVAISVAAAWVVGVHPSSTSPGPQGSAASPVALPFGGISAVGVAVDSAGTVFVTDNVGDKTGSRVLRLGAGASSPTVLPFGDLKLPQQVAVDTAGTVYLADQGNNRVLRLEAGATHPTVLPFGDLHYPVGVAVDAAGVVYVVDTSLACNGGRVFRLEVGAANPTVLPFGTLRCPTGLAVDAAGTVYVVDDASVWRLGVGATAPTMLPFYDSRAHGVAVDATGAVYVVGRSPLESRCEVSRLAAGAANPTVLPVLPIGDLQSCSGVAVDAARTVYVATGAGVLKLPVQ